MAGLARRRKRQPGDHSGRPRGNQRPARRPEKRAPRAQSARAPHIRGATARREPDHARGACRGVWRLGRARAPDRRELLRKGAEGGEEPRRRNGEPAAPAGALASQPLPWWEKLPMDASLSVRFTPTERRERGAARWVPIDSDLREPRLDAPCTVLFVIDRAPKPRAADGDLSEVSQ